MDHDTVQLEDLNEKEEDDFENQEEESCGAAALQGQSVQHHKKDKDKDREVIFQDAVEWMFESDEPFEGSIFTGLPDMLDVHDASSSSKSRRKAVGCVQLAAEYEAWFLRCAGQLFSRLAAGQCAIFSQTDTRVVDEAAGEVVAWMDKSHLLSRAAEREAGVRLLWHKIALSTEATSSSHSHRPCYTHVLCFGKHFTYKVSAFITPDLLDRGEMTWLKATGE
jgi:hypothetical protein